MNLFRSKYLLWCIVALAFIIRFVNVGANPPALSWDEASIGYNAYSILTTGKDEHGRFLPLDAFAAFGDYKPPLSIYLTVPFVALFGLNELSVRLPSVIAGTVAVGLMYLLVYEMFRESSAKSKMQNAKSPNGRTLFPFYFLNFASERQQVIALLSAALLAITPWHVMLSRAGFEGNIAVTILLAGVWLMLRARRQPELYVWSMLPFVACIYTFNSARYAAPLIALAVAVYIRDSVYASRKRFAYGLLVACIALIPIAPHLVSKEAQLRFQEVSIFTDLRTVLTSNTRREVDGLSRISGIIHNRRIGYAREYLIHFFDNLEPRFLFVSGDGNPKFSIRDTGQLLAVSAPFLGIGILGILSRNPALGVLLLFWIAAAIAPAGVARETPHALRVENALPVFIIFTAYGITYSYRAIWSFRYRFLLFTFYILLFAGNFLYFWHNLMVHYPKEYSGEWQYGYKQAIEYAGRVKDRYDTVVLTESIGRPYIYALFYERYDPEKFRRIKDASFDAAGFYNVYGFDKYRFVRDDGRQYAGRTLYILPPKDLPEGAVPLETFRLLNGTAVLVAFE